MFRLHGCLYIHLHLSRPTSLPSVGKYRECVCRSLVSICTYSPQYFNLNRTYILTPLIFSFVLCPYKVYPATNPKQFHLRRHSSSFMLVYPHTYAGALLSLLPHIVSTLSSCYLDVYYSRVALFYVFVISFEIKRYETKVP